MSDSPNHFRVVLRGYDPAQVDRRVHELTEVIEAAREQIRELSLQTQEIERDRADTGDQNQSASFVHLGERVGQILSLAEDEAEELRDRARAEMEAAQREAHEAGARVRAEAEQMHADASRQAKASVDAAQEQADGIVREARTLAARIRAESERELDAATQRRDSINAQLSNVRRMLATLSGSSPGAFIGHGLDEEPTPAPVTSQGDAGEAREADKSAPQPKQTESPQPAERDDQVNR